MPNLYTEPPEQDLSQPIRKWAENTPEALAISTNDIRLSYAELDDCVARCATFLADHDVADLELCALDLSDRLFFIICWSALFRLRVTSTAFSTDTPRARKDSIAAACGAGAVISDGDQKVAGTRLISADLARVMAHPYDPGRPLKRGSSRYAMLIAGSGTTGAPKIIAVSFDAILASAPTESSIWGLGPNDVTFTTVQPWVSSVSLRVFNALYKGGAFHIWSECNLDSFDAIEKARVNKIFMAVIHAEGMVQHAQKSKRRLPAGTELTIYASVVTEGLVSRIKENLTDQVRIVYGANELGVVADLDLTSDKRPIGSVGQVSEGAQVEIVDDNDAVLPAGVAGIVRARAPRLFSEYIGEAEETARVLRNGWFYPGDVAKLDENGHLILLGRSDQMMIYGGLNIYPAEIESVISTHPAVTDVAVMPMKHKVHQDVPICAVVKQSWEKVTEKDLRSFAKKQLGNRVPARIFVLDQIPRNDSGKIVRKELAAILSERIRASKRR